MVYAEHKDGKVKKITHELLSEAQRAGATPVAFIACKDLGAMADELAAMGAQKVYAATGGAVEHYGNETTGKVFLQAISQAQPKIVLIGATAQGKDLAPRIAVGLNSGLASDCTQLKIEGDSVKATRPIYAGKALADVEFVGSSTNVVTVRANALTAQALKSGAKAEVVSVAADVGSPGATTKEVVKGASAKLDVTEANIVISGGRSLKNAENFAILEKLASTLPAAAVGASRAAVDAGYRPHSDQVGQTGKVVSPSLYVACGISGAIQHLAGMRTSKVIVAVNKDPEAPIFQVADYGIVGDLFEVVPALTEEVKKVLGEH